MLLQGSLESMMFKRTTTPWSLSTNERQRCRQAATIEVLLYLIEPGSRRMRPIPHQLPPPHAAASCFPFHLGQSREQTPATYNCCPLLSSLALARRWPVAGCHLGPEIPPRFVGAVPRTVLSCEALILPSLINFRGHHQHQ